MQDPPATSASTGTAAPGKAGRPYPVMTRSVESCARALLSFHESNEEQDATIDELRLVKDLRRSSEGSGFGQLTPDDLNALVSYLLERRYGWSETEAAGVQRRSSFSPKAADKGAAGFGIVGVEGGGGGGEAGEGAGAGAGEAAPSTAAEAATAAAAAAAAMKATAAPAPAPPSAFKLRRCKAELNAALDVLISKRLCRRTSISLPLLDAFAACARETPKAVVRQQTFHHFFDLIESAYGTKSSVAKRPSASSTVSSSSTASSTSTSSSSAAASSSSSSSSSSLPRRQRRPAPSSALSPAVEALVLEALTDVWSQVRKQSAKRL